MNFVVEALLMGVFATIILDIWAWIAKNVLHLPTADWSLVGRWVGCALKGDFVHRPVSATAPLRHELLIGWMAHYVTGIVYGFLYLAIIRIGFKAEPSLASALIFGLITLAAPWLILQPGMGAGFFAARTPRPMITRAINLSMHVVFGVSLYAGWLLVQ